ncbi:MAG: iron ABC transporter substrate-binding protein [Candidatus Krumholzibacteriota bacterium]|nr:iron ABC transporter substrate-binding protein [Candidatus Krumholzibacteriota bacterium]
MKRKLIIIALVGLLITVVILSSRFLNLETENDGKTQTITDLLGRKVDVPVKVDRVVGVASGAVRMLTYLNATDMIVGVEDVETKKAITPYQFARPDLKDLPVIGPKHGGDAELIMVQQPDVIFHSCSQLEPATGGTMDDLQAKTGIPVVAIDLGDLGERRAVFEHTLRLMGNVLGKSDKAEKVISYIDGILTDLDARTSNIPEDEKPSAYVGGVALRGAREILSTRVDFPPFEYTNVNNVASSAGTGHMFIDKEQLLAWDPDILFIDAMSYYLVVESINNDKAYSLLSAVVEDHIYIVMPYNSYNTNFATMLANCYFVGSVVHPERFADVEPTAKADEIYASMVGSPVYAQMEKEYHGFCKDRPRVTENLGGSI